MYTMHILGDSIHIEEFEQNQVVVISRGATLEKGIINSCASFDLPVQKSECS